MDVFACHLLFCGTGTISNACRQMILKTKTMVLVMLTKVKMVNFIKIEIKNKKSPNDQAERV